MTPSDRDLPILIIGAGIGGLTAALALQNSVPLLLRGQHEE